MKRTINLGEGRLYIDGVDCGPVNNVTVHREEAERFQVTDFEIMPKVSGTISLELTEFILLLTAPSPSPPSRLRVSPKDVVRSLEEWLDTNTRVPRAKPVPPRGVAWDG